MQLLKLSVINLSSTCQRKRNPDKPMPKKAVLTEFAENRFQRISRSNLVLNLDLLASRSKFTSSTAVYTSIFVTKLRMCTKFSTRL
jgi:hypothetical protein